MNPFTISYKDTTDIDLIQNALEGSSVALEKLIKRHQDYIYNIALKMVLNPFDAEDLTQEVLIKVVTNLSKFKGKSSFRTWVYRITFNHFLKMKQRNTEKAITSFENFGHSLDSVVDEELIIQDKIILQELTKEAKLGCIGGMLLCLDRTQRLVFILGEIFDCDHNIGSELLEISKDNFRKRLERARRDLYNFMNKKCGLINKDNPCRCARKTSGFIKRGWVDKDNMRFNKHYVKSIEATINEKSEVLEELIDEDYGDIHRNGPFQQKEHSVRMFESIFQNEKLRKTFNLN
ncbi:MAG: RNA polymerase sigma factor [Bacteroidota bacterium]